MSWNGLGSQQARVATLIAACALVLGLAGCADGGTVGGSGTGSVTGGVGGSTGGVGGVGSVGGGMAGMMGGVGGMVSGGAGGMATGGVGGMTGGVGGMTTGGGGGMTTGGVGGMTTGGVGGSSDAWIRDPVPTESTVMAMGPYQVGQITEADGLRNGDKYGDAGGVTGGATVYYPMDAVPPFGGIVVYPGWQYYRDSIAGWGPFLASNGIVVMATDPQSVGEQPEARTVGQQDALVSLKGENDRAGSPLQGKLDTTRMGVMGWSMGGGGTWLSADADPTLKVAISLCGWVIGSPGSTTRAASLQFASISDILAGGMSQPVHAAIPAGVPKMLIEFPGADHFIANDPSGAGGVVGKYGLAWVKVFLELDERYRTFLMTGPEGTTDFQSSL